MKIIVFFENISEIALNVLTSSGSHRTIKIAINKGFFSKTPTFDKLVQSTMSCKTKQILINLPNNELKERFFSLPDNDFQGRFAELIDASKRKSIYENSSAIIGEEGSESFCEVHSREPELWNSVLGGKGNFYGKLKLDGFDIQTVNDSGAYFIKIKSPVVSGVLVHEIKTSIKGDLQSSFKKALEDKFFVKNQFQLVEYLVDKYGIKPYSIDPTTLKKSFVYYGCIPSKMRPLMTKFESEKETTSYDTNVLEIINSHYMPNIQPLVDTGVEFFEFNLFDDDFFSKDVIKASDLDSTIT